MKDSYTHLTLVIDRSGSMSTIKDDTEGGVNEFIKANKEAPGEATLLLVDFDAPNPTNPVLSQAQFGGHVSSEPWYRQAYLGGIASASTYHLNPRGNTALYDAVHKAIVETGEYLAAMAEEDRPSKVLFTIMTDGAENSSKEVTRQIVEAKIKEQTDTYGWEFVFLGAGFDVATQAQAMGISVQNTSNYAATPQGVAAAYSAHSAGAVAYRSTGDLKVAGKTDADGNVDWDEARTEVTK